MTLTLEKKADFPYAAHIDIRPMGEDRCLLIMANGEMFELDAPAAMMVSLLGRCNGQNPVDQILDGFDRKDDLREVLEVLEAEGCITRGLPEPLAQSNMDLYLIGDQILCEAALLVAGKWRSINLFTADELPVPDHPEKALIIALMPHIDSDWLLRLGEHAASHGCRWTQMHFDIGKAWMGPFVIPGKTSDYKDLEGRRRCAGDDVEGAQLRRPLLAHEGAPTRPPAPGKTAQQWMLTTLFAEIHGALSSGNSRMISAELEADPETLAMKIHPILPLPTRAPEQWLAPPVNAYDLLVNHRTGLILDQHQVDHHPELPANLITVRSHCSDLSRIYPWGNDLFVGGSSFGNDAEARGASLGEALERYCGNCLPSVKTVKGSYNQLQASGRRAVDPETLILHSKKMMSEPGCPFEPFTRDVEVHWVEGHSLTRDEPCLLPLSLVYANWMGGTLEQPITNYLYTPGMAAGQNMERALVGACRELVERDITMAWWLNAHPLTAVKPTPALEALWRNVPGHENQRVCYIHLDNPFDIPVIVAVVEHMEHQFVNIGFGCRPDPEHAAKKALTEALTLQEGSRDLLIPDSILRRSSEDWNLLSVKYRPWREDRSYMDAFRPDYRDLNDLMLQQQFYLDPRAIEPIRALIDPPVTRSFDQLPRLAGDTLEDYRKPLEAKGFEILYADITSPDVALTGYRVTRAIVPGLIPNMPAAFPAVGGSRVFDLPVQMGWREKPLTEEELNYFPMPHA